jgi:hypothetical protein
MANFFIKSWATQPTHLVRQLPSKRSSQKIKTFPVKCVAQPIGSRRVALIHPNGHPPPVFDVPFISDIGANVIRLTKKKNQPLPSLYRQGDSQSGKLTFANRQQFFPKPLQWRK